MEPAHRNKIVQNIEKLIQHTDYDQLMRQCIEHKLLFDVMQEQIEVMSDMNNLYEIKVKSAYASWIHFFRRINCVIRFLIHRYSEFSF